jgi:hypothetical protein
MAIKKQNKTKKKNLHQEQKAPHDMNVLHMPTVVPKGLKNSNES